MSRVNLVKSLRGELILLGSMIMPKAFWAPSPPTHYEVEEVLTDESIRKANIILPRGLAKSTLAGELLPIYHIWIENPEVPKLVVIVSKTQSHAINRLQAIKDIVEYSHGFRTIFGENWGRNSAKTWRNNEVTFKNGSSILARGMGQPIRGLNYPGGIRPTLIILDDPEDENNTKTIDAMEANFNWLLQGAIPALNVKTGRLIVIGTPLDQLCIVERLKKHAGFTTLWKQYLYEEDGEEKSIWPEMLTVDELHEERSNLEAIGKLSAFYRERMCVIMGDEERLFKEEYFMYYDGSIEWEDNKAFLLRTKAWANGEEEPEPLKEPEKIPVTLYTGVDPATSTKSSADYFAIVTIAVDKENNRYVLPYFRKRVTPTQAIAAMLAEYEKWKPAKMSIETVQAQETFRDILRNLEGVYIPGLAIKHNYRESKTQRYKEEIEGLEPYFYKRKIFFMKNQTAIRDELIGFPKASAHDDLIDALYLASRNIGKPSHIVKKIFQKSPYFKPRLELGDPMII